MKRLVVAPLFLVTVISAAVSAGEFKVVEPASVGFDASKLARIEEAMREHIEKDELVGGMGVVARGNKVVFATTWGDRDREKKLPLTEDTIFRIYSMSKPITSVAAMTLVEDGKLALDDPISKYLPELENPMVLVESSAGNGKAATKEVPADREITVRDLLRHTSGFTYGFFGNSEVDQRYKKSGILVSDRTLEDTITKLAKIPLKYQPGSRWHYSVSTDVLGRVIEVVSNRSFDQYLKDRIFEPLGMKDTFFTVPSDRLSRLAQLYTPNGDGGLKPSNPLRSYRFVSPDNRFYSGGGGLCSTAHDYMVFCQMLLGDGEFEGTRILKPETVRAMRTNQLGAKIDRARGFRFGLGFSIDANGAYGWGGAAGTKFRIDPKNNLITIYMVQISPTGRFDYGGEMTRLVREALN